MQNVFDRTASRSIMQWAHKWAREHRAYYHTYADALREGLRLAHDWAAGKLHLFYATNPSRCYLAQDLANQARRLLQPWAIHWATSEAEEEWRQAIEAVEEGDFIAANNHAKIAVPNMFLLEPIFYGWDFNRFTSSVSKLASCQNDGTLWVFWDRLPA